MAGEFPAPIDVLPHRDPILWVDEVTAMGEGSIDAVWTPNPDQHFRRGDIDPVVLIESIAQAGAYAEFVKPGEPRIPLFGGIKRADFGIMPKSGEQIRLNVELVKTNDPRIFGGVGRAFVSDGLACEAEISGVILPERRSLMMINRYDVVDGRFNEVDRDATLIAPSKALRKGEYELALDLATKYRGNYACGVWLPTAEWYAGHEFGGQAVLPGVRQVGAMRDLAQYHLAMTRTPADMRRIRFEGVKDVSFTRTVRPTEEIELEAVNSMDSDRNNQTYSTSARVAGMVASQATLFFELAA